MRNQKVKIKSFFGTTSPPSDLDDSEFDYWRLVGEEGEVLKERPFHPAYRNLGKQVFVKLNKNLRDLGLHAHNSEENALWFFLSDVDFLEEQD